MRHNLDPFGKIDDAALVAALRRVRLDGAVGRLGDSAGELSHGERQLLAIARVLLRPRARLKILVMDEPVAKRAPTERCAIHSFGHQHFH